MSLHDLVFSDLFVAKSAAASWFKATPDSMDAQPIPVELHPELQALRRHLDDQSGTSAFRIDWPNADGFRLRIERIQVAESNVVYVGRRFRLLPVPLTSLGMPPAVAEKLLAPELNEGLVIFFGKAGSGKTTTAASFIVERLKRFGGVCWTIENPIELPMQGQHGKGWCYQTEASHDDQIGSSVRNLLRATPNIIMIGEVRDGLAVREALAAAMSGHLVVATGHAPDLLSGIARLARLAGENAAVSIADAMRVGIHLALHTEKPGMVLPGSVIAAPQPKGTGTPARVLTVEPLWMTGQTAEGVRSMVRDGDFHLLKSEVERQRRGFLMGRLP